jgi:DUF4097 and DUF4098 domain-containing protein YvlB
LIAALLMAGCMGVAERHQATVERTWPADAIRTVKIEGVDGSLTVEAGTKNEIALVATVRSFGVSPKKDAENSGYFETELSGDTLRIGQKKRKVHVHFPFLGKRELKIDYALRVPPSVSLDLKTVNGRIATRGIEGETALVTINGTIDAEVEGKREMSARAVNGRIRAKFVREFSGANLRTVNGPVEAILPESASFSCNLSQVNGDFEASFPLSIHSHPGSRRVSGEVNGGRFSLRITTVNGDVEVQHIQKRKPVS